MLAIIVLLVAQAKDPSEGIVQQLRAQIRTNPSWDYHRILVMKQKRLGNAKLLLRAYREEFRGKPSPVLAAGLCRTFRFLDGLYQRKLDKDVPPYELVGEMQRYFETPSAMKAPPSMYEHWLLMKSTPPGLTGDEKVIRVSTMRRPDGTIIKGTVLDGSAGDRHRALLIATLLRNARPLIKSEPELAYMTAFESKPDLNRLKLLSEVVNKNPNIFGFAGKWACYRAASDLRQSTLASEWRARAMKDYEAEPSPLIKELLNRDYIIPYERKPR